MKLETLKRNKKKKILIGGVILLSLVSVMGFTSTRAKYKSVQSVKVAKGTINWKQYDFQIIAMKKSEDGSNYTDITTMPGNDYVVNEEKSYCTVDNKTQVKGKVKTIDGNHVITNLQKSDKCYLWFDKSISSVPASTVIANLNYKTTTPDFTNAAISDEGIYRTSDPMYGSGKYTYYWRGAATTNHVIFANLCWRIVRINGDGTIRLIYNGAIQAENTCAGNGSNSESIAVKNIAYNSNNNNSSYVGWTYTANLQRTLGGETSNAKTQTEAWYKTNITDKGFDGKVETGKFCNDRNTGSGGDTTTWSATGDMFFHAAMERQSSTSRTPSFSCNNEDIYTLKVGALTSDEVQFAGATYMTSNTSYYIYNGKEYWTMSPGGWYNNSARVFYVAANGSILCQNDVTTSYNLRPVINLASTVAFNEGSTGTSSNPYIVQ